MVRRNCLALQEAGRAIMRVSLFITCFNDTLFPETGKSIVRVMERLGHQVEFRSDQTCCGQMHNNSGYQPEALALVRRFVRIFDDAETILVASTSCTTMIRRQYAYLADQAEDATLVRDVEALIPRVFEFTEFLTKKLKLTDVGAYFPHRVTYHGSCNSLRGLDLREEPERLLRAVRGLDFTPLPQIEQCCGFGGTFAVKNAETSSAILADKLRAVLDTGAEICCAGDNSCLMHIGGGLSRLKSGVKTMHIAEILAATEGDAR
jgi:L-lactate dehydrogenase complex protein LldE